MDFSDKNVAIIGLGLLGSSLGMALRNKSVRRIGWARRPESREKALAENVVDDVPGSVAEVLAAADLTVVCLPIEATADFIERHAAEWRPGVVVTDVSSVKSMVMTRACRALTPGGVHFVGSHPMTGREKNGADAALPDLYEHAMVFIAPPKNGDEAAAVLVEEFWHSINCATRRIDAEVHDAVVAHTSHISHLAAYATVLTVLDRPDAERNELHAIGCAGGFKDATRIASSDPAMWREILAANKNEVLKTFVNLQKTVSELCAHIANDEYDELERKFAEAKRLRDEWMHSKFKKL